jgi:hypothetical protein
MNAVMSVIKVANGFRRGDVEKGLGDLAANANSMIDDLLWWTRALKSARAVVTS